MRAGLALPFRRSSTSSRGASLRGLDSWLARRLQERLATARIRLELWNGTSTWPPGERAAGELVTRDRGTLCGLVFNPDLHFGECYAAGRVIVRGDLARIVLALTRLNSPSDVPWHERLALWLAPANDLIASRLNARHHYDLGNDFYGLWLDRDMIYTCACYPRPRATLEEAQRAKLDVVCRKLRLRSGETVVEAGCGWGALALHMARQYGVRVRAFNVSAEQIAFARDRARQEGLAGRVEFIEDDYRNVQGRFDAFVSVGMLEHVGRRRLHAVADVLRRSLEPHNGRALLHFIGRDHARPLNAWIRRRIFPGAYAPTLAEVLSEIVEPAELSVLDVENLRLHYARTLRDWRIRFERSAAAVSARFGEAFCRAWHLYLAGSEAAFRSGWLQLFQMVCAPAGGTAVHWLRPSHQR